jgi:cytochrome P450
MDREFHVCCEPGHSEYFLCFSQCLGQSIDSCTQTITFTQHLFLALLKHPECLKRAQAELDGVLGAGPARFPTFEDRPRLPYVDALFSETLRWGVPVPLGSSLKQSTVR